MTKIASKTAAPAATLAKRETALATVAVTAFHYGTVYGDMIEALKAASQQGEELAAIRKAWIVGRIASDMPGFDMQASLAAAEARLAAPNAKADPIVNRARSACSYAFSQAGLVTNTKGAGRKPRTPDTKKATDVLTDVAKKAAVAAVVPEMAVAALAPKDASKREAVTLARRLATVVRNAENLIGADSRWHEVLALLSDIGAVETAKAVAESRVH